MDRTDPVDEPDDFGDWAHHIPGKSFRNMMGQSAGFIRIIGTCYANVANGELDTTHSVDL